MLSKEELRLLTDFVNHKTVNNSELEKLTKKLNLIVKQLDIMEKAQKETAEIQDEIVKLDGGKNEKENN